MALYGGGTALDRMNQSLLNPERIIKESSLNLGITQPLARTYIPALHLDIAYLFTK
jgi:hypothetical protein